MLSVIRGGAELQNNNEEIPVNGAMALAAQATPHLLVAAYCDSGKALAHMPSCQAAVIVAFDGPVRSPRSAPSSSSCRSPAPARTCT